MERNRRARGAEIARTRRPRRQRAGAALRTRPVASHNATNGTHHSVMQCNAMQCKVVHRSAVQCSAEQCTVLYFTLLYCTSAMPCHAMSCHVMPSHVVSCNGCRSAYAAPSPPRVAPSLVGGGGWVLGETIRTPRDATRAIVAHDRRALSRALTSGPIAVMASTYVSSRISSGPRPVAYDAVQRSTAHNVTWRGATRGDAV